MMYQQVVRLNKCPQVAASPCKFKLVDADACDVKMRAVKIANIAYLAVNQVISVYYHWCVTIYRCEAFIIHS